MQFELSYIPRMLPELLLLVLALLVLGADIFERWANTEQARRERHRSAGSLAAIGLGMIWLIVLVQTGYVFKVSAPIDNSLGSRLIGILYNLQTGGPLDPQTNQLYLPILGAFATDHLTMVGRLIFIGAAFLTALLTYDARPQANPGEFYALLLASTLGACLMGASTELITAFLAIELTSIPLYVLAGYSHTDARSSEAGMKYFVFGALSSGILLYGMSLAYGFAAANPVSAEGGANTQFAQIAAAAGATGVRSSLLTLAMVFIVAGMGYKVAAVPFHAWSPDVYQGAPTPITAFISTASKAAGFVLLLRVLVVAFPSQVGAAAVGGAVGGWAGLLALIALLTLVGGNLAALPQTNAKRLLAYSSIAQAGFLLLGIVAWSASAQSDRDQGVAALLYYVVVYCVANLGAFGALAIIGEALGGDELRDLNGLARRNLPLAALLAVCVLSLAGIPPLAGFFAKFYVFLAAWQAGAQWLVVVAIITTVVALYYYLRFLRVMFIEAPATEAPLALPRVMSTTVVLASLLVLALGLFPNLIIRVISQVQFAPAQ